MAKELLKGNVAIAEAAVRAGVEAYFGYPITPQTELLEHMAKRMPELGRAFVQAESEVAAINMVYGAASTGKRVMTSSSSPGVSLMQEGLSYIAGSEVPAVIVDVMRGGPGLGNIAPSQSRLFPDGEDGRPRRLQADRAGARHRAGSDRSDAPGLRSGGQIPHDRDGAARRQHRAVDGTGGTAADARAAPRRRTGPCPARKAARRTSSRPSICSRKSWKLSIASCRPSSRPSPPVKCATKSTCSKARS